MPDIIHLNFVGFMAGVAAVLDKGLRGRPFVIRGPAGAERWRRMYRLKR
jgi:hypothetical protein